MQKDVVAVEPLTPLDDVARLLVEQDISGVPVVDGTHVLGVVSRDDLEREARTAADAMSSPAVVVEPRWHIAEAARLMVTHSVSRLPVVRDGALVGIVAREDLVRAFTRSD